jgi:hypothetical protein
MHPVLNQYKKVPQERIKFTGKVGHTDLRALFTSLDEGNPIKTPSMMLNTAGLERFGKEVKDYAESKREKEEFKWKMTGLIKDLTEG